MFSLLKKTVSSLSGTRNKISHILAGFTDKSFLSESDIEQLEEVLLNADIGWELTDSIINVLREPDKKGTGIAGVYSFEIAEQRVYESMSLAKENDFPLMVTAEEV